MKIFNFTDLKKIRQIPVLNYVYVLKWLKLKINKNILQLNKNIKN